MMVESHQRGENMTRVKVRGDGSHVGTEEVWVKQQGTETAR